jgi:uncharacterized membrane protein
MCYRILVVSGPGTHRKENPGQAIGIRPVDHDESSSGGCEAPLRELTAFGTAGTSASARGSV